jgi:uncharacterized membrane protein YeaQ/YmgE (transglycosylase-associated protein family)
MFQLAEQIFLGLIVGTLAKLVMRGEEQGEVIVMALIGLADSTAGTLIGDIVFGPHHAASWILSIAGAVAIICIYCIYRLLLRAHTDEEDAYSCNPVHSSIRRRENTKQTK